MTDEKEKSHEIGKLKFVISITDFFFSEVVFFTKFYDIFQWLLSLKLSSEFYKIIWFKNLF